MASTQPSPKRAPPKAQTEAAPAVQPSSKAAQAAKTVKADPSRATSAQSASPAKLDGKSKQPSKTLVPTSSAGPRLYLSIALVSSAVLWFFPFSDWLLYPLRLMVTFFHEAGHALATFITFGSVKSLVVSPDGSGMVTRTGGFGPLISSAGYLGTTALGAALILLSRNVGHIPKILMGLGFTSIVATVLWAGSYPTWPVALALGLVLAPLYIIERKAEDGDKIARLVPAWVRAKHAQLRVAALVLSIGAATYLAFTGALLTMIVGIGGGAAMILLGKRAPLPVAQFGLAFLAVQTSFNALEDLRTLFGLSIHHPGTHTDAQNMAKELFLPPAFWASIWGALALLILTLSLWRFYDLPSIAMLRAKFSKPNTLASAGGPKAALPSGKAKPQK